MSFKPVVRNGAISPSLVRVPSRKMHSGTSEFRAASLIDARLSYISLELALGSTLGNR
jgi:hypothetical protein